MDTERVRIEDCKDWLLEQLRDGCGEIEAAETREKARKAGWSKQILKEARKELGLKTYHQFDEYGDTGNFFWCLP